MRIRSGEPVGPRRPRARRRTGTAATRRASRCSAADARDRARRRHRDPRARRGLPADARRVDILLTHLHMDHIHRARLLRRTVPARPRGAPLGTELDDASPARRASRATCRRRCSRSGSATCRAGSPARRPARTLRDPGPAGHGRARLPSRSDGRLPPRRRPRPCATSPTTSPRWAHAMLPAPRVDLGLDLAVGVDVLIHDAQYDRGNTSARGMGTQRIRRHAHAFAEARRCQAPRRVPPRPVARRRPRSTRDRPLPVESRASWSCPAARVRVVDVDSLVGVGGRCGPASHGA